MEGFGPVVDIFRSDRGDFLIRYLCPLADLKVVWREAVFCFLPPPLAPAQAAFGGWSCHQAELSKNHAIVSSDHRLHRHTTDTHATGACIRHRAGSCEQNANNVVTKLCHRTELSTVALRDSSEYQRQRTKSSSSWALIVELRCLHVSCFSRPWSQTVIADSCAQTVSRP